MTNRISRAVRASTLLLSALLAVPAVAACGGSTDDSAAPPTAAASDAPRTGATAPAQGSQTKSKSASLTWPQGTDAFNLTVCTSIGEHTIQGSGDSGSGKWSLFFDANLLESGDTGTLKVSQKSDMRVVYEADLTALTVKADGSFTGSGEDASKAPVTMTGTCDVTW